MCKTYSEIIENINSQVDFLKNERELAFNRQEQILRTATLNCELKDELIFEWLKIIEKVDVTLAGLYGIKKEINALYSKVGEMK